METQTKRGCTTLQVFIAIIGIAIGIGLIIVGCNFAIDVYKSLISLF